MTKTFSLLLSSLLAVGACANAPAQEPAPAAPASSDPVQVVEVSGMRNPELKPYDQMIKGLDAYDKFHALAPAAPLRFKLVSDTRELSFDKLTLRLSGANTEVPLAIGADGTFVLPRIESAMNDKSEIVSNLPKGQLRWRGDIRSPGVPANARRLGDLRLECEIGWAVNRQDMSFFARNSLSAMGGLCHAKMVGLRYQAPAPLASVSLVSGERKAALPIDPKARRVFFPPLADQSWNDDTLVVYEFEAAPQ